MTNFSYEDAVSGMPETFPEQEHLDLLWSCYDTLFRDKTGAYRQPVLLTWNLGDWGTRMCQREALVARKWKL